MTRLRRWLFLAPLRPFLSSPAARKRSKPDIRVRGLSAEPLERREQLGSMLDTLMTGGLIDPLVGLLGGPGGWRGRASAGNAQVRSSVDPSPGPWGGGEDRTRDPALDPVPVEQVSSPSSAVRSGGEPQTSSRAGGRTGDPLSEFWSGFGPAFQGSRASAPSTGVPASGTGGAAIEPVAFTAPSGGVPGVSAAPAAGEPVEADGLAPMTAVSSVFPSGGSGGSGGNGPPVAEDDWAEVLGTSPVTVDVLSNDWDPDGDPISVTGVTNGAEGAATTDGVTVTYSPGPGFDGSDSFTYTISDGNGGIDTGTVYVDASGGSGGNSPPVAVDDNTSTLAGVPVSVDVLGGDYDPDNDPLTVTYIGQPGNGSVSAAGSVATYTQNPGFIGTDSFSYEITDGNGGYDTGTVYVSVTGEASGRIAGKVWYDLNENGTLDAAEQTASGVFVQLLSGVAVLGDTLTISDGSYEFASLTAGEYTVAFVAPAGYRVNTPIGGAETAQVAHGAHVTGVDAGLAEADITVGFGSPQYVVEEEERTAFLGITLSEPSNKTVTVQYMTADGTAQAGQDYAASSGEVEFSPGETLKLVTVPVTWDTNTGEPDETVTLSLDNPVNATLAGATSNLVIRDTPSPEFTVVRFAESEYRVTEDAGAATVSVVLNSASSQVVTVDVVISDGTAVSPDDYSAGTVQVSFQPGETFKTVSVPVVWDTFPEGTETVALSLSNATNATPRSVATAALGITDVPYSTLPRVSFAEETYVTGEDGVQIAIRVVLSAQSSQPVHVSYKSEDVTAVAPGDYTAASGTLFFAPGQPDAYIYVPVTPDAVDEVYESLNLLLFAPVNAYIGARSIATVLIADVPAAPAAPTIKGPQVVPARSRYQFAVFAGIGGGPNQTLQGVKWAADSKSVTVVQTSTLNLGLAFVLIAYVEFGPGAYFANLTASYTLNGQQVTTPAHKVTVAKVGAVMGTSKFIPTGATNYDAAAPTAGKSVLQANNNTPDQFKLKAYPGSDVNKFTSGNATAKPAEPSLKVSSQNPVAKKDPRTGKMVVMPTMVIIAEMGVAGPAGAAAADLAKLEGGFIQFVSSEGTAKYGNQTRTLTVAGTAAKLNDKAARSIDWYRNDPNDVWPWYAIPGKQGNPYRPAAGDFKLDAQQQPAASRTVSLDDTPSTLLPEFYDASAQNPVKLSSATVIQAFTVWVSARTTDSVLDSAERYFGMSSHDWRVTYTLSRALIGGKLEATIKATGPMGEWNPAPNVVLLDVNIVPAYTLYSREVWRTWE